MDPPPKPGEADLLGQISELALEEGTPDDFVGSPAHHAADPVGGTTALQEPAAGQRLQGREPQREAEAVDNRQGSEPQQRPRRVELVSYAAAQGDGQWPLPLQPPPEAKLLDEADDVAIGSEEVVIELLEPETRLDLKARGQSTREWVLLVDGHPFAAFEEPEPHGQAEDARSEDGGAGSRIRARGVFLHRGREGYGPAG